MAMASFNGAIQSLVDFTAGVGAVATEHNGLLRGAYGIREWVRGLDAVAQVSAPVF